jgi:Fe-S-cluster containining protein
MGKFRCTRCGKCCRSLGPHIKVERRITEQDLYCRCMVTGDLFLAHIGGDFLPRQRIRDRKPHPRECPFLLLDSESRYICSIYETRPQICRSFICYSMLIFDRNNEQVGKVKGRRSLESTDLELVTLWEDIRRLAPGNESAWRREALGVLDRHGYRGECFE